MASRVGPPRGLSITSEPSQALQPALDATQAGATVRIGATVAVVPHRDRQLLVAVYGEQLEADYSRQGFVRGRSVRLMTVAVRPGSPNAPASSFVSGIIHEPLR